MNRKSLLLAAACLLAALIGGALVRWAFALRAAETAGVLYPPPTSPVRNKSGATETSVELSGKDLLAWKSAYEATDKEANARASAVVGMGFTAGCKVCVLPELPAKRLMTRTPTGDYQFAFGMELHRYDGQEDSCLLGNLIMTVTDFGAEMRVTHIDGGFFPLSDTRAVAHYIELFGRTEGVRANGSEIWRLTHAH
jgi:hypothetical protein